jgi:hypothetical protein
VARIALLVLVALLLAGCSGSFGSDAPARSPGVEAPAPSPSADAPARPSRDDAPARSSRDAPARPCVLSRGVVPIGFSATKYPNIRRHYERAVAAGWPAVLELNRSGSDRRRDLLLARSSSRPGLDRDEYPPAVGRASVRASIALVPSSENRSHGATLGTKLRRFCNGTRFRYVFY